MKIVRIEITKAEFELRDFGKHPTGLSLIYQPGNRQEISTHAVTIETDEGVRGEYVGGNSVAAAQFNMVAGYLIGKDPFHREPIYQDVKRILRKFDKMGIGLVDLPLWDLMGKALGVSVSALLGGGRDRIPCYASSAAGDRAGGLDSPEAYADFALACRDIGYPAFKLHIWDDYQLPEVVRAISAVRKAVGDDMQLMLDPGCKLHTFADAVTVGRACDDAGYRWLEDPWRDGGVSIQGHRRLRELIRTPLLQTEHVRGPEQHADFLVGGGTDFLRIDPEYDGGLTGSLKIAHTAESLGTDVEVHATGPAQRHLIGALQNTNYYEMSFVHPLSPETGRTPLIYADDYADGLHAVDASGCVTVPTGPGFGVTYDWDVIKDRAVATKVITADQ